MPDLENRMKRGGRLLSTVLAVSMAFAGCKTVHVKTAPEGCDVLVDGNEVGKSPCKFKVHTFIWLDYEVELRKDGYKPFKEKIDVEFGPQSQWMLLVLLVGIVTAPLALALPFFGDVDPPDVVHVMQPDYDKTPPPDAGIPNIPQVSGPR